MTQFIQFVESISQKFSTQNCDTSMALDLWLKDLRMADRDRESSMSEAEKMRLWEVIHACIDKALTDTLPVDVQSSKDGLKLLNAVFLKVINPEFIVYTERAYKFFNATPAVSADHLDKLQSEFANWLKAMTEVRYLNQVTVQELWNSLYKFFAHYTMIRDHIRDKWTLHGTSQKFDTLLASIPDAILMTQKALGVTPVEDGFQVQPSRNRNRNNSSGGNPTPGNGSSGKGVERRNSAPDVLKQGNLPPRQPLSQAERIKNGVCPNYPRNCRFGEVCKFQHVEPGKPDSKHVRSVAVKGSPNYPRITLSSSRSWIRSARRS